MTNPYLHYKPSGVDWLGDIPAHWEVKKIKYSTLFNKLTLPDKIPGDFTIKYIDIGSVDSLGKVLKFEELNFKEAPSRARRIVKEGDTIISTVRTYLKAIAYIQIEEQNLICSTGFAVLSPHPDLFFPKFLAYLCREDGFVSTIEAFSKGVSYPAIDSQDLKNFVVWTPPLYEQTAIANYLDEKTAQIDTLISEKRELINLLKKERSGLINEAVTQGLNHRTSRKESGLPWLGQIPAHWEVKKLKYVINKVIGGGTPSTTEKSFWDGEIPWVSPKDMKVELIESTQDYVTDLALQNSATSLVPVGSVLIVVRSGILKHTFPISINAVEVTLNQDMKALIPTANLSNQFLKWLLKGMQKFILTYCSKLGATVDSIETEALFNFTFSYPPLEEQVEIVAYLDSETARIDDTIQTVEEEINLLTEYRSALISEVVTGKQNVS